MKKKELIIILGSLLVVVLSISMAYFSTTINSKNSNVSTSSAELKIVFTSGTGTISGSEIEPGWSSGVNTFTVKNQSNDAYKYNIVIKDLINTFVTEGYLQYKITSTDGGYNMSDFVDVPKSSINTDITLGYNINIEKNKTHTYNVEFRYLNSETESQNEDMGKELSGTLYIDNNEIKIHGDYEEGMLGYKLLENNPVRGVRRDFTNIFNSTNTETLYTSTESIAGSTHETVYYFAGNAKNNWIKFGGYYWRIIRTNHDSSIRLLYVGISPLATETYIGKSVFNTENGSPKYVGYMYGNSDNTLDDTRDNTNDSLIKQYIDNWYDGSRTIVNSSYQKEYTDTSTNKLIDYAKYLSLDAVYCNDRELTSGESWSAEGVIYAGYTRIDYAGKGANARPTYDCVNIKDAFSGNNTEAKLKYPIALMTADEASHAGAVAYQVNKGGAAYFNTENMNNYFLLTPVIYKDGDARVWAIDWGSFNGELRRLYTHSNILVVHPVTSLKSCVLWKSGDGSPENPYEIEETESGC